MTFIKQKQRTGNTQESTLDSGSSTLDADLNFTGQRSTLDKDFGQGWIVQEQSATTTANFVTQKQRTGNIQEIVWDSGNTVWDTGKAPTAIRTIWDKDVTSGAGWVKLKQES